MHKEYNGQNSFTPYYHSQAELTTYSLPLSVCLSVCLSETAIYGHIHLRPSAATRCDSQSQLCICVTWSAVRFSRRSEMFSSHSLLLRSAFTWLTCSSLLTASHRGDRPTRSRTFTSASASHSNRTALQSFAYSLCKRPTPRRCCGHTCIHTQTYIRDQSPARTWVKTINIKILKR